MVLKNTKLFGGAISTSLPENALDVSWIREVPNTQEVYMIEQGNQLDQAIIVDLLETVNKPSLPEIMAVHLSDMLDDPPTFSAPLETYENKDVNEDVHTFMIKPAPSRQESESVKLIIFVAIIQVSRVKTDVILSMTVPVETRGISSEEFFKLAQSVVSEKGSVSGDAYDLIRAAAEDFEILDYGLFA